MAIGMENIVQQSISISRAPADKVDFGQALVFSHEYYFDDDTMTAVARDAESLLELGIKKNNGQSLIKTDPLYKAIKQLTITDKSLFVLGLRKKSDPVTSQAEIYSIATSGDTFDATEFSFSLIINNSVPVTISVTGSGGDDNLKILQKLLPKIETADTDSLLAAEIKQDKLFISPADISDSVSTEAGENTTSTLASPRSVKTSIDEMIRRILEEQQVYILLSPTRDVPSVKEIAESIKGRKFRYFTASDDSGILNNPVSGSSDIAHYFSSRTTKETCVLYSSQADNYPEFCWVSERKGYFPASVKWVYAPCGDTLPDELNETQLQNLMAKNANCYTTVAGRNLVMGGGVFSGGRFIDLQIGIDWQDEEIIKEVFTELTRKEPIFFDDTGITYMGEILRKALERGKKYFSASYEISLPKASEITSEQRAKRRITGITWNIIAKSGIQTAEIQGNLEF
jgi:hypothetical protein